MARLLIIFILIFVGWYLWQYTKSLSAHKRRKMLGTWGLGALLLISLVLVATGRMHWIGAAFAASLPLLRILANTLARSLPLLRFWNRYQGKPSVIKTRGLQVTIHFASGEIDGIIFEGPFSERTLNSLDESQLRTQLAYFKEQDRQSGLLLQAYILRRGFSGDKPHDRQAPQVSDMSRAEALQILGLEDGADHAEIIKAHRRLIQKLHPDRGGNDYLAAKVNLAKETLIN